MKKSAVFLAVLAVSACSQAADTPKQAGQRVQNIQSGTALNESHTIADVLAHPAFNGFADRLLPWDDGRSDTALKLSQTARLMPYHQNVNTREVLAGLNRLIADVQAGKQVFYEIYSAEERRTDPAKRRTGLFVFKGKANAPAVIISAGGGFHYVGSLHEAFPIAEALSAKGYNAFVVKYRAGVGQEAAAADVARAIEFISRNAGRLQTDMRGYSLRGASASARIAAYIGSYGTQRFGTHIRSKPAAVVMLYTGHSDTAAQEVPTFAVAGGQDHIAPAATMKARIERIKATGVAAEFHLYPGMGHGFALGGGTQAEGWHENALAFWLKHRK